MTSQSSRRQCQEAAFKDTIVENFTNLIKAINSYIQEAQEIPSSVGTKKSTKIHHKQTTEQYKEEILKIAVYKGEA